MGVDLRSRCSGDGGGRVSSRVVTVSAYSGWDWGDDHATFLVEAILIALIGIFWTLQTIDRRDKGAPTY